MLTKMYAGKPLHSGFKCFRLCWSFFFYCYPNSPPTFCIKPSSITNHQVKFLLWLTSIKVVIGGHPVWVSILSCGQSQGRETGNVGDPSNHIGCTSHPPVFLRCQAYRIRPLQKARDSVSSPHPPPPKPGSSLLSFPSPQAFLHYYFRSWRTDS